MLSKPFDNLLSSGRPDFPFCLCWANEDWTRAWDGRSDTILIRQEHSEADDSIHMHWLTKVFRDDRYIRINNKPVFLVYRARRLPSPRHTADLWRDIARQQGVGEIFLCHVESLAGEHGDPQEIGFDAAVEFQPDWCNLGEPIAEVENMGHQIYDYADFVEKQLRKPPATYLRFPGVTPGWDNSARRAVGALTLAYSEPAIYRQWLRHAAASLSNREPQQRIIFINAWNEWAEGNHLEPDLRFQRAYLSATRDAVSGPAMGNADPNDLPHPLTPPPRVFNGENALPDPVSAKLAELAACLAQLHGLRQDCRDGQSEGTRLLQDFGAALDHIIRIASDAEQQAKRFYAATSVNDELLFQEQIIQRQEKALERLQDELVRLENQLGAVLNSYSWRMTKPLREVLTGMQRLLASLGWKH